MRLVSLAQFLYVPLLLKSTFAYDCPMRECDYCLPAEIREAPGVGFEITTSYGLVRVQSASPLH
jgi:hypothetical protein